MTRGSVRERLGPLGERGFRLFITGYATSVFGSTMTPVAVTFATLDAGGGAADVGYVLAAETIPLVLFLLAGGVVADRFSRRALMLASDLSQAASQLALAVLVLTGLRCGSSWSCWPSWAPARRSRAGDDGADPRGGQRGAGCSLPTPWWAWLSRSGRSAALRSPG